MMYNREKSLQFSEEPAKPHGEDTKEPWMLPEVEQEFRRLTRNCSQPYDLYNGFKPIDCVEVEESIQKKYPVLAKKCQPHTIDAEETLETIYLPNPFYRIDDLNQLELQMRITSTRHVWDHPLKNLMSLINTQKCNQQLRCAPLSEVECPGDRHSANLNELFAFPLPPHNSPPQEPPAQTPFISSLRLIESIGDLSVRRSFRTSSRTFHSADSKTDVLPLAKKKSSPDGHPFTNLTLLTRPINRQEPGVQESSTFQVPETVLKWLQTGYPTRSKEFSAIQNLSDELRSVRSSLQGSCVSGIAKDRQGKSGDGNLSERKCEFSLGPNLNSHFDSLIGHSEPLSAALSSTSTADQNRSRNPKPNSSSAKIPASPVSNISYSAISSGGLSGFWQSQGSSLWFSKPLNSPNLSRDNAVHKSGGKAKCRPILNSQHKDSWDEDVLGFDEGSDKKRLIRGMADIRTFQYLGESSFDDLERQAIEQWPSEDNLDIFQFKHFQLIITVRMTTKLRHPNVAPLRAITTKNNFVVKTNSLAKRKSAVQILQETKAFYVKSETVLDKKQELKPSKVAVSDSTYGNFPSSDKAQKYAQKNNKLQDKLRLLLDIDSLESNETKNTGNYVNVHERSNFGKNTRFQHKSLPDLHASPYNSSSETSESSLNVKYDGDSRSAYSSLTQTGSRIFYKTKSENCRPCNRLTKNLSGPEFRTDSRTYSSFRVTKSGEFIGCKAEDFESSYKRRSSNTSSCNRSRRNSSSKHSQSADSGRQSQGGSVGLRTGRSGLPEFSSPPLKSSWSDSGTEDDSPPLFRRDSCDEDKKRPILRSKSDISYKYCASKSKLLLSTPILPSSLPTAEKLETFFDHLGMDPIDFKELASDNSRSSSPVFFSSVSSIDSCVDLSTWGFPEPSKVAECPSIVERNARIIKWLYNCRKFQKVGFNEQKTHLSHSCEKP